jgi:outer membrane protein OmpA-like peptidoglycan-associated protein
MRPAVSRFTLLGSTALVGALAALTAGPAQAQMYSTGPGTYLSLEGRYMWNAGDKAKNWVYSYAPQGAGFDPYDTSKSAADKGWGGKAMLGYRFNNNWDIGLGVAGAWLKGKDDSHGYNYIERIRVDALAPNAVTDHIKTTMSYTTVDFEAGYNMPMGGMSNFRIFGGLRFAYLKQKAKGGVEHAYFYGADEYFDYSGQRKTTFMGIGPRIGANGSFGIGNSGFNIFGGLAGALLIGKYKDRHSFSYTPVVNGPGAFSYTDRKKTKIVPNVEGEIGLGYNFGTGSGGSSVGLQVGYRGEAFFGAATKGHVIAYFNESASGDYLMHGPFVRLIATFGAPAAAPVAAPPPPPPPRTAKSFIVFFDFDRSNITAQAQATINDAVAAAKAGNSTRITLTGHTDRSGSEQYNQALSVRRGEAVKAAMIRGGIPANAIVVIGRGESQPLVPTADGVREPQNRRVEIVI